MNSSDVPTIDIQPFIEADRHDPVRRDVAESIRVACSELGFFQVIGHGADRHLRSDLESAARLFFALGEDVKAEIEMARAGSAWRGWFPVGAELTSGVPDAKEGVYFGLDLDRDDPRVLAGLPLHGPNLYPEHPRELAVAVSEWMTQVTAAGQQILGALALGLELPETWFERWCADPMVLFRLFHYPGTAPEHLGRWGVAEHTDYGMLTLLAQDDSGGLQARGPEGWIDVPPTPDALVCNLGDMLERVTGGIFRSTPHRVLRTRVDRISMPLFLDPSWDAMVFPIPGLGHGPSTILGSRRRWDNSSVFDGPTRYGDYLTAKVAKVFPRISGSTVDDGA